MFVDLCLHRIVDGVIVGSMRDVRRHMDGVSHLKAERARENTKGGVGQYIVTGAAKATQVIRAETVWAHFIAEKNLPFPSVTCSHEWQVTCFQIVRLRRRSRQVHMRAFDSVLQKCS